MRTNSMLVGAIILWTANAYGIFISTFFQPVSVVLLVVSLFVILSLSYIELNKRRVLVDSCRRESFMLFIIIIIFQVYFTITAFTVLIYLNSVEQHQDNPNLRLDPLIAGLKTLPIHQTQLLNLIYYYANFLGFMFYIRCYYVMFWRDNFIFIFRYLKAHVKELNQTLLSHLPRIELTADLEGNICPLCLQEYSYEEPITKLHCQHIFHLNCIKLWVTKSNNCPLCRKRVVF